MKNNRKKFILIIAAIALMLTACNKDTENGNNSEGNTENIISDSTKKNDFQTPEETLKNVSSDNIGTENVVTSENKSDLESEDKPPYALNGQITMMLTEMTEQSPSMGNDIFTPHFIIINSTEYDYFYGLGFSLERMTDNGVWEKMEQIEPMVVIDIDVMVLSGESSIFDAPITSAYGELEAGNYRIVLNVSCEEGLETLYGEFKVK